MDAAVVTGILAAVLAGLHLAGRHLFHVESAPRRAWLSAASGVSLAYVFVHLLPEVAVIADELTETEGWVASLEHNAWVMALVGLVTFYALQRLAERAKATGTDRVTSDRVGWVHIGAYAIYNALIGALLLEQAEQPGTSVWLYTAAMGVHLVVNDHGLREDHGALYHDRGRYVLAAAVLLGWLVSLLVHLPPTAIGLPLAFLAGSVVLTVIKEELPEERDSRVVPLALGAAVYAGVLLAV